MASSPPSCLLPAITCQVLKMPISISSISRVPLPAISSLHIKIQPFGSKRRPPRKLARSIHLVVCSLSQDRNNPVELDVRFPADYSELLEQGIAHPLWHVAILTEALTLKEKVLCQESGCLTLSSCSGPQAKEATESALKDKKQLLEIEFPTSGLESVAGDGEGGIEMTESMQLMRGFCDRFIVPEKATRTRVFFPEANEVDFARQSAFGGTSLRLDYLTKPSLFEDFGFVSKVKMADHVKPEDEIFLVAYPYFNVNEMLVVEELYEEAVVNTDRKLIIFNGELDRIRSGYYPPFFYPRLAALGKTFLPKMETVYYVHNFKGRNGGTLFRSYPGPWTVLRNISGRYICLHQQEEMPSLKEVALNILPSA